MVTSLQEEWFLTGGSSWQSTTGHRCLCFPDCGRGDSAQEHVLGRLAGKLLRRQLRAGRVLTLPSVSGEEKEVCLFLRLPMYDCISAQQASRRERALPPERRLLIKVGHTELPALATPREPHYFSLLCHTRWVSWLSAPKVRCLWTQFGCVELLRACDEMDACKPLSVIILLVWDCSMNDWHAGVLYYDCNYLYGPLRMPVILLLG